MEADAELSLETALSSVQIDPATLRSSGASITTAAAQTTGSGSPISTAPTQFNTLSWIPPYRWPSIPSTGPPWI